MQAVQRTERWKVMWKRVRESLTWPLRNCFLQLELETSDTPHDVMDDEMVSTLKLDIPFQDVKRHTVPGRDDSCRFNRAYDEIIEWRQVEGELRKFTVVASARIYNRKTGRAYDLQEGGIGVEAVKEPVEVETNRRSILAHPDESEFRWCFDRGPCLRHAHVIEYVRDRLRQEVGCYFLAADIGPHMGISPYFGDCVEDELRVFWDEAAAGEMMMEQTLVSQLHRLEFSLRLEHMKDDVDHPNRGTSQEWKGLEVAFSINSVFPPPQRPKTQPWQKPEYACFDDDVISEHLQVAAILLLLGEPLPWFPPGGKREHARRQADAAALATWLKKGSCRARLP